MKSRFTILVLVLVLFCQTGFSFAQQGFDFSPSGLSPSEFQRALLRGDIREQGNIGFSGAHTLGTFRQPQEAASETQGGFTAQGVKRLSGWLMAGNFRYGRTGQDSVSLTTVSNALNRNPYILADTNGGAWLRDDIALETALCTPLLADVWTFGVRVKYGVGQGARRNDPRPLFRYRALSFAPALTWNIAPQHSIGAALEVQDIREDAELGFFTNDYSFVWRMRGLASYDRIPFVSSQRTTQQRSIGAALHYEFDNAEHRITAALRGYSRVDSVRDGVAEPQFAGAYIEQGAQFLASASERGMFFGAEGRQELLLTGAALLGRGIDPIFRAANTTDNRMSASLTGRFYTNRLPYNFAFQRNSLDAALTLGFDNTERRDIAADIRSNVAALSAEAALESASILDSSNVLDWRVNVGIRTPLSAQFLRNPSLPVSGLERVLAAPDFAIRSAQVLTIGGQLALAWKADAIQGLWLRAGMSGSFALSNHVLYTYRASLRGFFEIIV